MALQTPIQLANAHLGKTGFSFDKSRYMLLQVKGLQGVFINKPVTLTCTDSGDLIYSRNCNDNFH